MPEESKIKVSHREAWRQFRGLIAEALFEERRPLTALFLLLWARRLAELRIRSQQELGPRRKSPFVYDLR